MKEPKFEQPKKYSLPNKNIIPLGENSEVMQKKKAFFEQLSKEGIDWPIEIQGGGKSDIKNLEFKIFFPTGDIFLSFAVTIHELGHLRQGEIDPRFAVENLGTPEAEALDELEGYSETEKDTFERGLKRMQKFAPEALETIEEKFTIHKKEDKLLDFKNFQDFYDQFVKISLRMTEFVNDLKKGFGSEDDAEQQDTAKKFAEFVSNDPLTNKFLTQIDKWRCGELLDADEMKEILKKVTSGIAKEPINPWWLQKK